MKSSFKDVDSINRQRSKVIVPQTIIVQISDAEFFYNLKVVMSSPSFLLLWALIISKMIFLNKYMSVFSIKGMSP
jgi:hypothetical protein